MSFHQATFSQAKTSSRTVSCEISTMNLPISSIEKILVVASAFLPIISASRWDAALGWCLGTANGHLYEGDFSGDGRTDLLCHRVTDGYKWIAHANPAGDFASGTTWEASLGWCFYADRSGAELYIGDFNGDGKDDMLCHDANNGYKWIAHANDNGNFASGTTWEAPLGWCFYRDRSGAELHIGDFNGDGKDDMLCHDANNGYKWIAHANADGNFASGTTWEAPLGWCFYRDRSGAELHIGDFNGDGKDDLLCHDSNTGYKWIAYANGAGNFEGGTDWEEGIGWCYHSGAELHIGDANGDGKDDLFCHDTSSGYKWVALSNCQNNFHDGTSWEAGLGWCYHAFAQFFIGDYNGDSKADMLCHDTNSGYKWMIYAVQYRPYQ